jgi:hypothetical protein
VVRENYHGPGDYLHDAILYWVGEGPTRECGCQDRINQMNRWGVSGCRQHFEEIVAWLMKEFTTHKWVTITTGDDGTEIISEAKPPKMVRLARHFLKLPMGGLPIRFFVSGMVTSAIWKVEKATRSPVNLPEETAGLAAPSETSR